MFRGTHCPGQAEQLPEDLVVGALGVKDFGFKDTCKLLLPSRGVVCPYKDHIRKTLYISISVNRLLKSRTCFLLSSSRYVCLIILWYWVCDGFYSTEVGT